MSRLYRKTHTSDAPEFAPCIGNDPQCHCQNGYACQHKKTNVEPSAWSWDQATYGETDVRGRQWYRMYGNQDPKWPWMTRNVTPLYTHPDPRLAEAVELLEEAEDYLRNCANSPAIADRIDAFLK